MRRARVRIASGALAAALVAGCAREEPPPREIAIELGTGEWRFEPLVDGQEVRMIHGAQGGWHVWTSVRAADLDPDRVRLELYMRPADEPESDWDTSKINVNMVPDGDAFAYLGYPFVVVSPACAADRPLEIRAVLRDRRGTTGSDSRVIVPTWTPVEGGGPTTCD